MKSTSELRIEEETSPSFAEPFRGRATDVSPADTPAPVLLSDVWSDNPFPALTWAHNAFISFPFPLMIQTPSYYHLLQLLFGPWLFWTEEMGRPNSGSVPPSGVRRDLSAALARVPWFCCHGGSRFEGRHCPPLCCPWLHLNGAFDGQNASFNGLGLAQNRGERVTALNTWQVLLTACRQHEQKPLCTAVYCKLLSPFAGRALGSSLLYGGRSHTDGWIGINERKL